MKLSQKDEQFQRQRDTRKLLASFQQNVDHLLQHKTQAVSFQLAYDNVFKLTKLGRQTDLLALLDQKLKGLLEGRLEKAVKIGLGQVKAELKRAREVAERMTEICLFLDINYCQKTQNTPLAKRLNAVIFTTLCNSKPTLDLLAIATFQSHTSKIPELKQLLDAQIAEIDESQTFFDSFLIPNYVPLIVEYFRQAAAGAWQKENLPGYVNWCRNVLMEEDKFLRELAGGKNKKKEQNGIQNVIAGIYKEIVASYKQRIYQTDQGQLFEKMSLPILELFKYGKGKQVQGHIQWFMAALEKRLNKIPIDDNSQFIDSFCQLYDQVASLLKGTQSKFQINYRSIFAFQEWINNEKYNIPLRLNHFIDDQFSKNIPPANPEAFVRKVILVFKLVKEKNIFENVYRRMLINRLVHNYLTYDVKKEKQIVDGMEHECGEEWSQKINAICELFVKDRQKLAKQRGILEAKEQDNINLGGLVPVIIVEDAWPFENKSNKIVLNDTLLGMTHSFEKQYLPEATKNKLLWSARAGIVILDIKFNTIKRFFYVSVDMANLLLYLEKGPKKLASFLCQHCYATDQVQGFLQTLISQKVVKSEAKGSDYELTLSDTYEEGPMVDLVRGGVKKLEMNAMQELKADRKLMVQAIIVKLMKAEKVCKRQQLLEKSAPLVNQRGFKFNADFVQKAIDRLIDKEFIRDFEDGSLGYIA